MDWAGPVGGAGLEARLRNKEAGCGLGACVRPQLGVGGGAGEEGPAGPGQVVEQLQQEGGAVLQVEPRSRS